MNQKYQEELALFRYRTILPLLNGELTSEDERRIRGEILAKEHVFPDGSVRRIAARTLRSWLRRYRQHKFDGLFHGKRQPKGTKGKCTAIPEPLLEVARELREEDSRRSVELILQIMQDGKGLDVSEVNPRTLMRYFKRLGLKKSKKERGQGKGQHERFEQEVINAMWQGDTSHAVYLPDPTNPERVKKAKLVVFVDDASRICPHGEFYFDEQLPSVLDAVAKALLARGKPKRILLDNAKTFRSTTLELMCAELDIGLSFCRPRRAQGKGKVERFIRTVKSSFCKEAAQASNIQTLEELNAAFQGWLELYENKVHDELNGMTPVQRWRKQEYCVDRSLTESQILRAMMMRETRIVHINTALVRLDKNEYQVSRELAGQEVEVRWNPERVEQVEIWKDGRYLETALLKERKPHVQRDWRQDAEVTTEKKLESSSEFCAALMEGRLNQSVEPRGRKDLCKLGDFIELLAGQLKREDTFEEEELKLIEAAFKRLAPFEREATEEKIAGAVEDKGVEKHVRFYLERLEPKAFRR